MVLQRAEQKGYKGHSARLRPSIRRPQIGQANLIFGRSGSGLGAFRLTFLALPPRAGAIRAVCAGCAVCTSRGCFARSLRVRLGCLLVRVTAIIRLVEAGASEEDSRSCTEDAAKLRLLALRALLQGGVAHGLEFIEIVIASVALVFVGRHSGFSNGRIFVWPRAVYRFVKR